MTRIPLLFVLATLCSCGAPPLAPESPQQVTPEPNFESGSPEGAEDQANVYGASGIFALGGSTLACRNGLVDVGGVCCWPGQEATGGACSGEPSSCPAGFEVRGDAAACVSTNCPAGMTRDEDGTPCCWPGQTWSDASAACTGTRQCPAGFALEADGTGMTCVPRPAHDRELAQACEASVHSACEELAHMRLEALAPRLDRYLTDTLPALRSTTDLKRLQRVLKAAVQEATELSVAYTEIAGLPSTAASHKTESITAVGVVFHGLADSLVALPPPVSLTAEQAEVYHEALLEQAQPLYERARQAYDRAIALAAGEGLSEDLVQEARRRSSLLPP